MSSHSAIPSRIPFRTLNTVSGAVLGGLLLLAVVGAAIAFLTRGEDPARLWHALLFNWLFWSSVAIGMVMLAVALRLTEAEWSWSLERFALGGVAFLPIAFLLLLLVLAGNEHYFHHWLHAHGDPVIDAKRGWLNLPFLLARNVIGVAVLFGLAILFAYHQLRPDVYGAGVDDGQRGWYRRLTGGWRGTAEEAARSQRASMKLGVILGLAYAVLWGIVAIDLAMSLNPHWFSTMFPVAFFWTAFHGGVAMTAIMAALFYKRAGLDGLVTGRQWHDLGKMLFAFSVFWMYLNWSQYIVIWYGMLPFEQEFFIKRFSEPFATLSKLVPSLVFVIPFFGLLTRPPKRIPMVLAFFGALILIGHWLERFLLIVPSLHEGKNLPLGIPEVAMGLAFLGLFAASYLWFLRTFPLLPSPANFAARGQSVIEVPVETHGAAA